MKHRASRDLYAYWNSLRGARPAPERSEIDPGAIRGALGDTIMLTRERGKDATFRLAGTRVCALFCRELKGSAFPALFHENSRAEINELVDLASEDSIGFVAGLSAGTADGPAVPLELLLLPLAQRGMTEGHPRGMTERHLFGVLAPAWPPLHLGLRPVQSAILTSWRHVGPQLDETIVPKFFDLPEEISAPNVAPAAAPNRTFVLLNGGRS